MQFKEILREIDQFFRRFFSLIYEYIPPEYFAFISGIVAVGTFTIAAILFSLGDPFDFFSVYISNIPVGPHGSGIVFASGMGLTVLLILPFGYALKEWLWGKNRLGNTFLVLGIIGAILAYGAFILVLFFDMETALMIHDLSSAAFFTFSLLTVLFFTLSMEVNGKATKLQWIFTSCLITLGIIFIPWYIYTIELMFPFRKMSFEEWVIMMGSLDPKMDGVRYFEWLGAIFAIIWIEITGINYRYLKAQELEEESQLSLNSESDSLEISPENPLEGEEAKSRNPFESNKMISADLNN